MKYDFLHEAEEVSLRSDAPRQCSEIDSILEQLGYTLHEDIYSLERSGAHATLAVGVIGPCRHPQEGIRSISTLGNVGRGKACLPACDIAY
jgi:hypothetical protein